MYFSTIAAIALLTPPLDGVVVASSVTHSRLAVPSLKRRSSVASASDR